MLEIELCTVQGFKFKLCRRVLNLGTQPFPNICCTISRGFGRHCSKGLNYLVAIMQIEALDSIFVLLLISKMTLIAIFSIPFKKNPFDIIIIPLVKPI